MAVVVVCVCVRVCVCGTVLLRPAEDWGGGGWLQGAALNTRH